MIESYKCRRCGDRDELLAATVGGHNRCTMQLPDYDVPTAAELTHDALAMNRAALSEDYDEVRFRLTLVIRAASRMGQTALSQQAQRVHEFLGPLGTSPPVGYGFHLRSLSTLIAVVAAVKKRKY